MPLQYISDNAGNHTAVLIPINEWELLTRRHEDLKQLELPQKTASLKKASDFFGSLSIEDGERMQAYTTQSRNERERNFL